MHGWKEAETALSHSYEVFLKEKQPDKKPNQWVYKYVRNDEVRFDEIDKTLNSLKGSFQKCEYLIRLNEYKKKNRFVHSK